jgi:hypothetical protein
MPSARQTVCPGDADDSADWADETLDTVEVQPGVGGVVELTVQDLLAGVGSALPTASVARTEKRWDPRLRPE